MHVLMLGWEFPPYITGGLGTACFGLTRAMDRRGMTITFVVPKAIDGAEASHVRLLGTSAAAPLSTPEKPASTSIPDGQPRAGRRALTPHARSPGASHSGEREQGTHADPRQPAPSRRERAQFERVHFIDIPAEFSSVYEASIESRQEQRHTAAPDGRRSAEGAAPSSAGPAEGARHWDKPPMPRTDADGRYIETAPGEPARADRAAQSDGPAATAAAAGGDYDGDIIGQVERYAHFVLDATRHLEFDIIHAHDWMTYPAGMMLARLTGKPLVVHIHSTEFDRCGEQINQRIYEIERRGMNGALRVIAVSQLTKNMVVSRYAVPGERVEVVYNGVDLEPEAVGMTGIRSKDKIVLYFGRITHQKGPEYFIRAAKRVLEVMDNVKFVVAGSGDMAKRMIEMAAEMGIGQKVLFTGFLRGHDIKRVFSLADLYVMPSVSEPFGIAPLEAMSHNVPALISKSSGVSEVLKHALKVDFWDVDDMANKIVAVLRHPPLHRTLQEHGSFEVRRLTWDGAAERCEQVYEAVLGDMVAQPTG